MNNTQLLINLANNNNNNLNNHKMIEEWRGGYVMNEGNKDNLALAAGWGVEGDLLYKNHIDNYPDINYPTGLYNGYYWNGQIFNNRMESPLYYINS